MPSFYRWENRGVNRWNELWAEPGLVASFSFSSNLQPSAEGGLPTGRAVGGDCFSEMGLISPLTLSPESTWHVILSRVRGILRRGWSAGGRLDGSFGTGPCRSGESEGGYRQTTVFQSTCFTVCSEPSFCPFLVVRPWAKHFALCASLIASSSKCYNEAYLN